MHKDLIGDAVGGEKREGKENSAKRFKIELLGDAKVVCENTDSIHGYFAWPSVARLRDGRIAVVRMETPVSNPPTSEMKSGIHAVIPSRRNPWMSTAGTKTIRPDFRKRRGRDSHFSESSGCFLSAVSVATGEMILGTRNIHSPRVIAVTTAGKWKAGRQF